MSAINWHKTLSISMFYVVVSIILLLLFLFLLMLSIYIYIYIYIYMPVNKIHQNTLHLSANRSLTLSRVSSKVLVLSSSLWKWNKMNGNKINAKAILLLEYYPLAMSSCRTCFSRTTALSCVRNAAWSDCLTAIRSTGFTTTLPQPTTALECP